ncbi:MAG TPA: protein kinase [Thermomicrobiales bacterium]|jgi:serine/threonine protein kinase
MTDLSGQTYGNYRLDAALGAGALAEVYRAAEANTGRIVALKVFQADLCADPDFVARFLALAPKLAAVTGSQIASPLDWGQVAGRCYLTLRYFSAGSLRQHLDAAGDERDRSTLEALDLLGQAASAVADLHQQGFIHGDLRPENLLLERGPKTPEQVYVADFALADLVEQRLLIGAPAYLSPEQLAGHVPDRRGDIYALGVILYEILTGAQPFATTSFSDAIYLHSQLAPVPPRARRPDLPATVEAIVLRCLAKEPAARYASAAALAADLRAIADELHPSTVADDRGDDEPDTLEHPLLPEIANTAIVLRLAESANLTLTPGEPQTLAIVLENHGTANAQAQLTVEGAPAAWVALPSEEISVVPGGRKECTLAITVARDPHHSAGEYPVNFRATPRDNPEASATATTLWTVRAFTEGELTLIPSSARERQGHYTLQLHNSGNAPLRRTLAINAAASLTGQIVPNTIDLDPDATALIDLTITAPRPLFGRVRHQPFTVEALSTSAAPLTTAGVFTQRPVIPIWLAPVVLALLAAIIGGAVILGPTPVGNFAAVAPSPTAEVAAPIEPTIATAAGAEITPTSPAIATATSRSTVAATTPGPLALSSTSLSFGTVPVGGNAVQNIQVRNTTPRTLTFKQIQIEGADAADFTRAGPCGLDPLAVNLACPLTVIFSPSGSGNRVARLTITLTDGTMQAVNLSGIASGGPLGTPQIAPPTKSAPPLAGARGGQAAAILATGRKLLVTGGRNGPNSLKSVETYDLVTNTWVGGRDMSEARAGHTATTLPDGMVVVLGGRGGTQTLKSAEIYDPATQGWSAFPALTSEREGHTTTLLVDGRTRGYRLLVLGGRGPNGLPLTSGEIYDSNTRGWAESPRLIPDGRAGHTATILNGATQEAPRILIVGGVDGGNQPAPARIFDPLGNGGWTDLPGEPAELTARSDFSATLVEATGQVLFIGGTTGRTESGMVTVYDPAVAPENAWREAGDLLATPRAGHTATLLPYGRLLITGGRSGSRELTSTELFDPARVATPQP